MRSLKVALGARSYPILIGRGLAPDEFARARGGRPALCLVDANVARLHASRLEGLLPRLPRLEVPPGEDSKRLAVLERLALAALERDLGRDGVLFAVGGGVTGDLVGFLAASYMRGIPFIQVPTTLLAQVDASVGGKVAVNLPGAKNALGAFHQPEAVLAELEWLTTLPPRELAAGLAEMLKMAALFDPALLARLETLGPALLDPRAPELEELILRSCDLKRGIVQEDETEQGRREVLNFGHTLAHAVESAGLAAPLLHGEAVAIGMLFALRLGERLGISPPELRPRLADLLADLRLPLRLPPGARPETLQALMGVDKKRREAGLRFVLLEDWGRPERGVVIEGSLLSETLAEFAT